MTGMEIALLIVGVIIFVISFMLPEKTEPKTEKEIEADKEEVHRLVEQEIAGMKLAVNEATNDTVEYAVGKAERSLEKVSNEKIMAVNEYAGTILEEINKNHQEVMFLYDMLRDKQADLTNTVRKAEATGKEIAEISHNAQAASETLLRGMSVATVSQKGLTSEQKSVFDNLEIPAPAPVVFQENAAPSVNAIPEQAATMATADITKSYSEMPIVSSVATTNESKDKSASPKLKATLLAQSKIMADLTDLNSAEPISVDSKEKYSEKQENVPSVEPIVIEQFRPITDVTPYIPEPIASEVQSPSIPVPPAVAPRPAGVVDLLTGGVYKGGNIVNPNVAPAGSVTAADIEALVASPTVVNSDRGRINGNSTKATNNNEEILKLADAGMDTMTIAKSLKLGVGEVKLVLDLYRKN